MVFKKLFDDTKKDFKKIKKVTKKQFASPKKKYKPKSVKKLAFEDRKRIFGY